MLSATAICGGDQAAFRGRGSAVRMGLGQSLRSSIVAVVGRFWAAALDAVFHAAEVGRVPPA
jgi:hypothetical protein